MPEKYEVLPVKRPNFQLLHNGNVVQRPRNIGDQGYDNDDETRKRKLNRPPQGKKRGWQFSANQREIKIPKQQRQHDQISVEKMSTEFQKNTKLETSVLCEKSVMRKLVGPLSEACIEKVFDFLFLGAHLFTQMFFISFLPEFLEYIDS